MDVFRAYVLNRPLPDRPRRRVIGCNLPIGNGPLLEQAPAMAELLRDLLAGVPAEQLRLSAASIIRHVERHRAREPGEDDE